MYMLALRRNDGTLEAVKSKQYDDLEEARRECRSVRSLYAMSDYVVMEIGTAAVVYPVKILQSQTALFGAVLIRNEVLE